MGVMLDGAPGTIGPGAGARTPYAMCPGAGRFTGVPTADIRGPPIGWPMVGVPYTPTPGAPGGGCACCLLDLLEEPPAVDPFVWPVIGP